MQRPYTHAAALAQGEVPLYLIVLVVVGFAPGGRHEPGQASDVAVCAGKEEELHGDTKLDALLD